MNILIADDEASSIRNMQRVLKDTVPDAFVLTADNPEDALWLCRDNCFDVAFLDVEMPGMNGITLAKEIKSQNPLVNIVIVTAYPEYALDALRIYVSGYILKPVSQSELSNVLLNLRTPPMENNEGLFVKCFGNFEVFYDGKPIKFLRLKSKELLAYLVDRNGSAATNAQCCAVLWGDDNDGSKKQRYYFHRIWADLKASLDNYNCGNILVKEHNAYSVDVSIVSCDYYLALKKDAYYLHSFTGEYMSQYSWAEGRIGTLVNSLSTSV